MLLTYCSSEQNSARADESTVMLALCRNFTHNLHGAFAVKTVQVVRIFKNENHQKSMTMESQSAGWLNVFVYDLS